MGSEIQYLYCTNENEKYSPFCYEKDIGTTPAEIIAAQIDAYEWQYLWTNYPQYHQYTSYANYADVPSKLFTDGRRFLSTWAFDWSQGELADNFRRLGVTPPTGAPSLTYYNDLGAQFNQDISVANQLYAAASQGVINQSSGERPFVTAYDSYFGDTTQQGIAIDKILSLQAFTALWPIQNYDQNQAAGLYQSAFSFQADPTYEAVAEASTLAMIGGSYDMFAYSKALGVQQFATATNSVDYQDQLTGGRPEMKDWIGGYVFTRLDDFLNFFRLLAVENNTLQADGTPLCGQTVTGTGKTAVTTPNTTVASCTYDPTIQATPESPAQAFHSNPYNQFQGPDYRRWIWVYLQDVNKWIVADQDRNVATFIMMYNYTSDVLVLQDDGNIGNPYGTELPLKYMLNYYLSSGQTGQ
jgi:hypothetical protein